MLSNIARDREDGVLRTVSLREGGSKYQNVEHIIIIYE